MFSGRVDRGHMEFMDGSTQSGPSPTTNSRSWQAQYELKAAPAASGNFTNGGACRARGDVTDCEVAARRPGRHGMTSARPFACGLRELACGPIHGWLACLRPRSLTRLALRRFACPRSACVAIDRGRIAPSRRFVQVPRRMRNGPTVRLHTRARARVHTAGIAT